MDQREKPVLGEDVPSGEGAAAGRPSPLAHRLPYLFAAALAVIYMADSLVRHAHMRSTGYDLGIFEQAIRAYSRFEAPVVPLKGPGFNLLGDHFHPWLAALGPLYRLWPDARLLLVVQALLIAVSVVPIGRVALERLGIRDGIAVMAAYGLSWGIQGAVSFDFHEIALAVPLLAFAMVALLEERWNAAAYWTLPVLLVKEDMGLTVAAVGGYLLLKRRWRIGAALVAAGVGAIALVTLVIIPLLSPTGDYAYWGSVSGGGTQHGSPDGNGGSLLASLAGLPASMVEHPQKTVFLLTIGLTTALAALRSPILLVALPVVGYRVVSSMPLYWSTGRVHYNAVLMPIVFVALVGAVVAMRASPRRPVRWYARAAVPLSLVIGLATLPRYEFAELVKPGFYGGNPHLTAARGLVGMVPDDARVAATNFLVPQLTGRCEVVLFPNVERMPVDWVLVDTKRPSVVPVPIDQIPGAVAALPREGFQKVAERDGVMLWRKRT
ncbi:DUF2079 domain-containing protein [Actinomadura rubrisoli]|uniref:DUF2079 domain-containing protein n=1 Tax=Actinomadura rubrisoli TaxID=2530368 RepID=A0A4R5BXS8_9ACTN|nr:DUF2079 domain-containing protein [Actinomadura rubrisoli]TDD90493.1 DUF2079 domain-containing protein [Actinomadura rubrisoli]